MTPSTLSALFPIALLAVAPSHAAEIQLLGVTALSEILLGPDQSLTTTFTEPGESLQINAPAEGWDWSRFVAVAVDIRNTGASAVTLIGDLDHSTSVVSFLHLPAGAEDSMVLYLMRKNALAGSPFTAMNGSPGGRLKHWEVPNLAALRQLRIADLDGKAVGGTIEILAVRGIGQFGGIPLPEDQPLFPFVDEFGQYKHQDWPGKVHSTAELDNYRIEEAAFLEKNQDFPDRGRFGGWTAGPTLEATGHFRTEKYQGKWWLVDPEGYLFWSHGTTGVGPGAESGIKGREHYFEQIPAAHTDKNHVDFYEANMERKYGGDWRAVADDLAHRRLRSWGMNTIANWSRKEICEMGRTPYVVAVSLGDKEADCRKDPEQLRMTARQRMQQAASGTADDPWCIGYFVDNELDWKHVMDPEDYYRIVSEEVKRAAPHKLYMGSRLHGHKFPYGGPDKAAIAASRYCDVIGINRYRFSPSDLRIAEGGVDKPIIIGEFHFGALDRGLLHTGLRGVGSQAQRAYAYRHYVSQALAHPNIVGTHWFQYRDQALTGRGDGENYQIGFVNVADNPHPEMVEAARWIGEQMYTYRLQAVTAEADRQ